jgi:hypothetical protein
MNFYVVIGMTMDGEEWRESSWLDPKKAQGHADELQKMGMQGNGNKPFVWRVEAWYGNKVEQ